MAHTVEDLLEQVGGFSKGQASIVFSLYSIHIGLAWSMMHMTFCGIIPDWFCEIDSSNLTSSFDSFDPSNATNYQVCSVNGTQCDRHVFDRSILTVINEWDLVCDEKWVKATLISVQMGGVLAGAVLSGYLGDHFGRKKCTYFFVLWNIVSNLVAAFSVSWAMFGVLRFFCGVGVGGALVVAYPYALEFMPLKWRPLLSVLPSWVVGVSIFALASYLLKNWMHLHLACAAIFVPMMLGWFIIPESIRWLAVQNRVDEAFEVFEYLAKKNGKELPLKTRAVLMEIAQHEQEVQETQKQYGYLDLFKTWALAKPTIIVCFHWCSISLIYYGIGFAVSSFSGNFYLNVFVMNALDIPFMPITFFLMNKMGRKKSCVMLFAICCAAAVACLVTELRVSEDSKGLWLNVFGMIARVSASCGWCVVMTLGTEVYPTVIRNLGFGSHNAAARVGAIIAPYLINLDDTVGVIISYVVVSGLSFLVGATCLFLPETSGVALADSMKSYAEPKSRDVELQEPGTEDSKLEISSNGKIDFEKTSKKQETTSSNVSFHEAKTGIDNAGFVGQGESTEKNVTVSQNGGIAQQPASSEVVSRL